MVEIERTPGGHLVHFHLFKQDHQEPVAQDCVQKASECPQRWGLHNLSVNLCQCSPTTAI